MIRRIAICIPLNNSFLKETLNLYDHLDNKFKITFMKNKDCRPHINLCSGSTNKFNKLLKQIKKIKNLDSKKKINYLGRGMFVGEKSTFYLRFSNEKILSNLRNKILHSKNWTKIDETSDNKMWIPKSSIIHKELSVKNKSLKNIIRFLNSWKFSKKNFLIKEISIIDFTKNEYEVESFKI